MKLTLDIENTVTKRNGKLHLDPFEPDNTMVMVGMLDDRGNEYCVTFDHSEHQPTTEGRYIVQKNLDDTALLIMHNASHDLMWLWESGFTYEGEIFDTMLGEYVLQRGQKEHYLLRLALRGMTLTLRNRTVSKSGSRQVSQCVTWIILSYLTTCLLTYMLLSNCMTVCG